MTIYSNETLHKIKQSLEELTGIAAKVDKKQTRWKRPRRKANHKTAETAKQTTAVNQRTEGIMTDQFDHNSANLTQDKIEQSTTEWSQDLLSSILDNIPSVTNEMPLSKEQLSANASLLNHQPNAKLSVTPTGRRSSLGVIDQYTLSNTDLHPLSQPDQGLSTTIYDGAVTPTVISRPTSSHRLPTLSDPLRTASATTSTSNHADIAPLSALSQAMSKVSSRPTSKEEMSHNQEGEFALPIIVDIYKAIRPQLEAASDKWRISDANLDYQLAPTYPSKLIVPRSISDTVLKHAAKFRSKQRIPVLTYIHPTSNSYLLRSSQPQTGLKLRRNIQDEKILEAAELTVLIDPRPLANVLANQAMGYGIESPENYSNCTRRFLNIENIHVMRDCQAEPRHKQEQHLITIVSASNDLAADLLRGENILVHCSDGWDRTAQIIGLAILCLERDARTFDGFYALIEKEWISFGHKFRDRCLSTGRESAPVFLQFLECVTVLMRYYPSAFEFTETWLQTLWRAVLTGSFLNFIGNCESERGREGICFWAWTNARRCEYLNGEYDVRVDVLTIAAVRNEFYRPWEPLGFELPFWKDDDDDNDDDTEEEGENRVD